MKATVFAYIQLAPEQAINWTMRRICLVFLFILCACTGSSEAGVPTLLVIGYGGENARLALVEDTFFSREPGAGRSFELLATLDVPGRIAAHDVVDRDNLRTSLALLSLGTSNQLTLGYYGLRDIGLGEDLDFGLNDTDNIPLELTDLENGPVAAELDASALAGGLRLEVSELGRFAALLVPAEFRATLYVIDVEEAEVVSVLEEVEPEALFLDQNTARLYFLNEEAAGQELQYLDVNSSLDLDDDPIRTNVVLPERSERVRDLKRLGSVLVALQEDQYTPITLGTPLEALGSQDTIDNAQSIIALNEAQDLPLILRGQGDVAVHRSLTEPPDDRSASFLDASAEPGGGFVYFLQTGQRPVVIFSLLDYQRSTETDLDSSSFASFAVTEDGAEVTLDAPTFTEWTKAVPTASP